MTAEKNNLHILLDKPEERRADYVPAVKENHAKVGLCLQFVVSPMVTLFHNLHRFHKIVSFDIGRDDSNFLYNHIS